MSLLSRLPPAARKIVSVAFLLALAWLGARMCRAEVAEAELVFRIEEGGRHLRRLEVRLHRPQEEEILGMFRRVFDSGTAHDGGTWPLTIDAGQYVLDIELSTEAGITREERLVTIEHRARVTVPLEVPAPEAGAADGEERDDAGDAPDAGPPRDAGASDGDAGSLSGARE